MTTRDCLSLLEINGRPTKLLIKKAFRKAALKHHPDTRGNDSKFIEIKEAYDTLMSLPSEELAKYDAKPETIQTPGTYDPFTDHAYKKRTFFEPENPNTEGFERKVRARGCPNCDGYGFVTKNTDPSKGFLGRERRLCKCQWA